MSAEGTGANPTGAASGADLGGSSKHSNETLEGSVWRRVPRQLRLYEGESVLNPRLTLSRGRGCTKRVCTCAIATTIDSSLLLLLTHSAR